MKLLRIEKIIYTLFLCAFVFLTACQQPSDEELSDPHIEKTMNDTEESSENASDADPEKEEDLLQYFPIEIGYQYNVLHAMDGLGEGIEVLFQDKNRFFAKGHYGSALGFYRIYEVRATEIAIVFEVTEENFELYEQVAIFSEGHNLFELPKEADFEEFIVLSLPIEKGSEWVGGKIIEEDVEIKIGDHTYQTIVVDYEDKKGTNGFYYAKDKGLVRIEYEISELFDEPQYADLVE